MVGAAQLVAIDHGHHARLRLGARVAVQHPADRAARGVQHDQRATLAGIGEVRGGAVRADAHVVHVAALRGRRLVERIDADHLVGAQVDLHQLDAAGLDELVAGGRRVDDPEEALRVHGDALDADEVVLQGERVQVAPSVPRGVRVGPQLAAGHHLGDRDGHVGLPAREVDEHPALLGHGDPRHLLLEACHHGQGRFRGRRRRPGPCGGDGGGEHEAAARQCDGHRASPETHGAKPASHGRVQSAEEVFGGGAGRWWS